MKNMNVMVKNIFLWFYFTGDISQVVVWTSPPGEETLKIVSKHLTFELKYAGLWLAANSDSYVLIQNGKEQLLKAIKEEWIVKPGVIAHLVFQVKSCPPRPSHHVEAARASSR